MLLSNIFGYDEAGVQKAVSSLMSAESMITLHVTSILCLDGVRSFSLQTLVKNYDQDMETLNKTQKTQVEKAEQNQTVDMKNAAKRLKMDQVRNCGGCPFYEKKMRKIHLHLSHWLWHS